MTNDDGDITRDGSHPILFLRTSDRVTPRRIVAHLAATRVALTSHTYTDPPILTLWVGSHLRKISPAASPQELSPFTDDDPDVDESILAFQAMPYIGPLSDRELARNRAHELDLLIPCLDKPLTGVAPARHLGKIFPSRSGRIQTLPDCNSGCPPVQQQTTAGIHMYFVLSCSTGSIECLCVRAAAPARARCPRGARVRRWAARRCGLRGLLPPTPSLCGGREAARLAAWRACVLLGTALYGADGRGRRCGPAAGWLPACLFAATRDTNRLTVYRVRGSCRGLAEAD